MTEEKEYEAHKSYGPFEESFGTFVLTPTSDTHIHVDANHNSASDLHNADGLRITVRGIPYGVSAHLYRLEDGTWTERSDDDGRHLYMSRLDRYTGPRDLYASPAAERYVREHLYPVVAAWAESPEGIEARAEAQKVDTNNTLWRLEQERAKAQAALDAILSDIDKATEDA